MDVIKEQSEGPSGQKKAVKTLCQAGVGPMEGDRGKRQGDRGEEKGARVGEERERDQAECRKPLPALG